MPQLHLYVPDEVAERLREEADKRNVSLSKYLAQIVERETNTGWPAGYFERIVGSWKGDAPEIPDIPLQEREAF